jgi:predicted RNase H-like HicB family nuclease
MSHISKLLRRVQGRGYSFDPKLLHGEARKDMEKHYHINVFWWEHDQRWVADVPDLKSCSAHGATPEEAVAGVQIAMELWLEVAAERGMKAPEAKYRAPVLPIAQAA